MPPLAWPAIRGLFLVLCATTMPAVTPAQARSIRHPDGTTHWYEAIAVQNGIDWTSANAAAAAAGGYLATITSAAENAAVFFLIDKPEFWRQDATTGHFQGPWLGGVQTPASTEPDHGWRWAELEPYGFERWAAQKPDDAGGADRIHFYGVSARAETWSDATSTELLRGYVIEYSGPFSPRTIGLLRDEVGATDGYTLIDPSTDEHVHLIDSRGRVVHSWVASYPPAVSAYLLENGNLLRTGRLGNPKFTIPGNGGVVERFDWSGKLLWRFDYSSDKYCPHHDIELLPNGNILMIVWELKTRQEAIAAGRNPSKLKDGELWPDKIVEVKPTPHGGNIVWEWHVWDHLVQDFDKSKDNYENDIEKHPELVDINYIGVDGRADWMHTNAIDYNAKLDQIMISVRSFDEIWVIDHSTTTAQAASHKGGRSGEGGDLLFRWGNPSAYRKGNASDRRLYRQHDARWIDDGLPGAGHILVFNNGVGRPQPEFSSVDEIVPPEIDTKKGKYKKKDGKWGPADPTWTYRSSVFANFVSGAQRLRNGNTVICAGNRGHAFEVTPGGEKIWEYFTPIGPTNPSPLQGDVVTGNVTFRAPRYGTDHPALRNRTLHPQDPLEGYEAALLVEGSTLDYRAQPGELVSFSIRAKGQAGRGYRLATSLQPGPIPIDHRFIRIGIDSVFGASLAGGYPNVFRGYFGKLDGNGRAEAALALPNVRAMLGGVVYTAFLIHDPTAPLGIGTISNTVVIRVPR